MADLAFPPLAFIIIGLLVIVFTLFRSELKQERREVIIAFLNRELGR